MNKSTEAQLMSDAQYRVLLLYFFSILLATSIFGIFSNIANIVVFYKMGFSVASNINLFCLAITDLYCVCHFTVISLGNHPLLQNPSLVISMQDLTYFLTLLYYGFSAVGSWITAIISVERSCCIAFPMKVKQIFTTRTIIYLIAGMVIYQLASGVPRSFAMGLTMTTSPLTNRTVVIFDFTKYRKKLSMTSLMVSYSIPTLICFIVVSTGTVFLIAKFNSSRLVRESMTGKKSEKMATKDAILVRSVILICITYIVGSTPNVLVYFVSVIYPRYHVFDPFLGNITKFSLAIVWLFQAVSYSINIFVYLRMSSVFRQTFIQCFLWFVKL